LFKSLFSASFFFGQSFLLLDPRGMFPLIYLRTPLVALEPVLRLLPLTILSPSLFLSAFYVHIVYFFNPCLRSYYASLSLFPIHYSWFLDPGLFNFPLSHQDYTFVLIFLFFSPHPFSRFFAPFPNHHLVLVVSSTRRYPVCQYRIRRLPFFPRGLGVFFSPPPLAKICGLDNTTIFKASPYSP